MGYKDKTETGNLASRFCEKHLFVFEQSVRLNLNPDTVGGKKARSFAQGLQGVESQLLKNDQITRSYVFELTADQSVGTPTVCAAVMAWGGMHINHRDMLFALIDGGWLKLAEEIRAGKLDRQSAYDGFRELREMDKLKGMGPAYFTKLIYFLAPRNGGDFKQGYILDQWAGCSINLLNGRDVALMDSTTTWKNEQQKSSNFIVSDFNTSSNYEEFCQLVDALAKHFGTDSDQIDRALMSDGGRNPALWREYVSENRKP